MRRTDDGRESKVCQTGATIFGDENVCLFEMSEWTESVEKFTDSFQVPMYELEVMHVIQAECGVYQLKEPVTLTSEKWTTITT